MVKTLERDGFLHRRHLEPDRRMVELSLSEMGEVEFATTFRTRNRREELWAQGLSAEERKTMIVLLGKFMDRRSHGMCPTRS